MARTIQGIFFDPPIAVARLGGSDVAQHASRWAEPSSPRTADTGETILVPDWSFNVLPDGSVAPFKPVAIELRDGAMIRPVCPFFELWALLGEPGSAPDTWEEQPVTPTLLEQFGATPANLTFRVDARNAKAARRTRNPNLRFGTFPALEVRGDDHGRKELEGRSAPGASPRMIPPSRHIPLGFFQVLRSQAQPSPVPADWVDAGIRVDIVRVRFTPGKGNFYGPPQAAQPRRGIGVAAVEPSRAFLNANAGWAGSTPDEIVSPSDTYDGAERTPPTSLGVIDDTCDARIDAILTLPGAARTFGTHANVFVGPPDYAPDRRPFLSAADELNDRASGQTAVSGGLSIADRSAWVQDLFERIFETASLLNVDYFRAERGRNPLPANRLRPAIPGDQTPRPTAAMGGRDALRNQTYPVAAPGSGTPLPLTGHAKRRHRDLSDINALRNFVAQNPDRLGQLVRAAFEVEAIEDGNQTTMRMPPFMRQSNALPLTLTAWQHDLLMAWRDGVVAALEAVPEAPPLSEAARERRDAVLARIRSSEAGTR